MNKKYKPVFFDCGRKSLGEASNIEEARGLAWEKLPEDIKEQLINIKKKISKNSLTPTEFTDSWIV